MRKDVAKMANHRTKLLDEIGNALSNKEASDKLWEAMDRGRNSRTALIQKLGIDIQEFKHEVREIKNSAKSDQTIVSEFAEKVRANGGNVFLADDGDSAIKYVLEICKRTNARLMVKAKSLTSEEIWFNHGLESAGLRVVETDLGELICQVAHEKPSHLVFPAVHKTSAQIATLFSKEYGENIQPDPSDILKHIRARLRPIFLTADIGVTGANIGVAESGSVVIETNEGNGRLVTSIPKIHIVIIGSEKIVPFWEDASNLIQAHTISATGQRMTAYVSIISQHIPLGGKAEGREFHVIILDNGRSKMHGDAWYSDALNCIRCGACMNICPTYGIVGGHVFGYVYPGPIGIPWTSNVHGVENATFAHLCISCGLCKEICPVDIDIPLMIAKVKQEEVKLNGQLLVNSFFVSSDRVAKIASATAPLSNWMLRKRFARYAMEKIIGVDRRRTLPSFARKRLRRRLKEEKQSGGTAGKVVFFPDIYADYNDPELGVRAVRTLRQLGYIVELPELKWSGMPYISYGEIEKAKKVALYNIRVLSSFANQGYEIISTEPTAVYMLKEIYPMLQPGKESQEIANQTHGFFAHIQPRLSELKMKPSEDSSQTIGFHIPCHERALTSGVPAMRFLESSGYVVKVVETGTCCGIGGTFGMKKGNLGYDLSMAVGEKLFEKFRASGCKIVATESSVCSSQLTDGLGYKVLHPLYMVKPET